MGCFSSETTFSVSTWTAKINVIKCKSYGRMLFMVWLCIVCAGKHWIKSMLLTASLFPFTCFGIGFALNTVAIFYHSLAAIPFGTMVSLVCLASFIENSISIYGIECTSCTSQFQTVRPQTALIWQSWNFILFYIDTVIWNSWDGVRWWYWWFGHSFPSH